MYCALGLGFFLAQAAKADFVTPYALNNFTLTNTNADGTASTPDMGASIVVVGGNNGTAEPGTTDLVTMAQAAGLVQFQWSYFSEDLPTFDDAGYLLNGSFVKLADTSGESGMGSFTVTTGESFGFRVDTDNQFEPGILTVSAFSAPTSVPEPGTASMVFLCLPVAAGLAARRQLNRKKAD